ncbi:hypothetical protein Patl1_09304 [Pistacia atlantica]|uniref:Uncharacterized protein n=1 Tax=Pistacia atlantica TaxID=434234 RepID=A0ACC1AFA7_9ROSI|nr:hypothetical protein Patl1_09304 [Pistacia atlantica]
MGRRFELKKLRAEDKIGVVNGDGWMNANRRSLFNVEILQWSKEEADPLEPPDSSESGLMASTSGFGTTGLSCKAKIEKFDGTTSFVIWQVRMMVVLTKEGTKKALQEKAKKPETMTDDEWEDI